jgi:hypothetical protein
MLTCWEMASAHGQAMNMKELQERLGEDRGYLELLASGIRALTGGDGSLAQPPALPIHEHYKIYRAYVEHEDVLINNRQMWNITIQGFLFATYGFSVQKLTEILAVPRSGGPGPDVSKLIALKWIIWVLPFFGAAISIVSWMGVNAARRAIDKLTIEWAGIEKPLHPKLPSLTGGGADTTHKSGFLAPRWFPWFFVFAWLLLILGYRFGPWLSSLV